MIAHKRATRRKSITFPEIVACVVVLGTFVLCVGAVFWFVYSVADVISRMP